MRSKVVAAQGLAVALDKAQDLARQRSHVDRYARRGTNHLANHLATFSVLPNAESHTTITFIEDLLLSIQFIFRDDHSQSPANSQERAIPPDYDSLAQTVHSVPHQYT